MPDFLVFQLYGAMASWGNIAVGEHRPSLGHPTKSAINGLLAAALGIDRGEEEKHLQLAQHYGIAVCVLASGELLRDYHTVQVPEGKRGYASRRDELMLDPLNLHTILSQRDYRTDVFYEVAIWYRRKNPLYTLDAIRERLLNPYFTLYLGRKSCPICLPLNPIVFTNSSLRQAFDAFPINDAKIWKDRIEAGELISYYWESGLSDDELGDLKAGMVYPRRDQVSSRKRWQFTNRDEFYYARSSRGG